MKKLSEQTAHEIGTLLMQAEVEPAGDKIALCGQHYDRQIVVRVIDQVLCGTRPVSKKGKICEARLAKLLHKEGQYSQQALRERAAILKNLARNIQHLGHELEDKAVHKVAAVWRNAFGSSHIVKAEQQLKALYYDLLEVVRLKSSALRGKDSKREKLPLHDLLQEIVNDLEEHHTFPFALKFARDLMSEIAA